MKMQNKETNYRSSPEPEHTTVGLFRSSARAAGCGWAGQMGTPTGQVAQKLTVLRARFWFPWKDLFKESYFVFFEIKHFFLWSTVRLHLISWSSWYEFHRKKLWSFSCNCKPCTANLRNPLPLHKWTIYFANFKIFMFNVIASHMRDARKRLIDKPKPSLMQAWKGDC